MRLPKHIGIIPDGNRRWAKGQGMDKSEGYGHGISPGMSLYHMCRELGIGEMSFYGLRQITQSGPLSRERHLPGPAWRR